ncbi:MAG: hypothetical protein GX660_22385 [Clostridiaceae bacterium]|nr:hypothetical protein [Clostridiaceae bacterium]
MREYILAIDPGNKESAYCLLDKNLKPVEFGKFSNENVRVETRRLFNKYFPNVTVVIEMVASYGMTVGKEVFETCVWIGRFYELFGDGYAYYIYRKDEKINLCGNMKAKDGNIIQALKDRFGDKGTKKNPGWFYGFSGDIWQAYAVGVTYYDMYVAREVS